MSQRKYLDPRLVETLEVLAEKPMNASELARALDGKGRVNAGFHSIRLFTATLREAGLATCTRNHPLVLTQKGREVLRHGRALLNALEAPTP